MGEQVVREQDGLRVLQVGAPRHDRLGMRLGLGHERVDDAEEIARDDAGVIEQVQTHERRDLVVAAAPRPQLAAELGTDLGDEGGLERAVHVFVAGSRLQSAVLHARRERVEPACIRRSSSPSRYPASARARACACEPARS